MGAFVPAMFQVIAPAPDGQRGAAPQMGIVAGIFHELRLRNSGLKKRAAHFRQCRRMLRSVAARLSLLVAE